MLCDLDHSSTSAVPEALLRTPAASAVEKWLFEPSQTLHAPHLLDIEVAQVVRRYAAYGEIDVERGCMALADLTGFPLHRGLKPGLNTVAAAPICEQEIGQMGI